MQQVNQALNDVRDLYLKLVGTPAPELQPGYYVPFPPGVDPVDHAVEEIQKLKQLTEEVAALPTPATWIPRADCFASKEAWTVCLEIPGVKREDVKVVVDGGECLVRGERKLPVRASALRPLSLERPWGPFERRFLLPAGAHAEKLTASYADGVLQLKLAVEGAGIPERKEIKVV